MGLFTGWNAYSLKLFNWVFRSKFYGVVFPGNCPMVWVFAHLISMAQSALPWNRLVDVLSLMPFEVVYTSSCVMSWSFAPYGIAHGPKTWQIQYQQGSDFAELISLKPLDWFSAFEDVFFNCLGLQLCAAPCHLFILAHIGSFIVAHSTHMGVPIHQNVSVWNHWMDFLNLKFRGMD